MHSQPVSLPEAKGSGERLPPLLGAIHLRGAVGFATSAGLTGATASGSISLAGFTWWLNRPVNCVDFGCASTAIISFATKLGAIALFVVAVLLGFVTAVLGVIYYRSGRAT